MSADFGSVLIKARKARGMTQGDVAAAFKISRPAVGQWESGKTAPETERLGPLAELLGFDLSAAVRGELILTSGQSATGKQPALESNVVIPPDAEPIDTSVFKGPRNVPVYGTGSGGDGKGDFTLNGQIIDHAPRPPGIANRKDVYVVYLVGDSVSPAYEEGSPIYVDPHRRPAPRDYVFVELRGEIEGEAGQAFVKRFVRRGGGKLYLEQHRPEKQLDPINEADVVRVHRVIPWPELIGI